MTLSILKKSIASTIIFFLLNSIGNCAFITHHVVSEGEKTKNELLWQVENIEPFTELMVSWDATRPQQGFYLIQLRSYTAGWSEWVDYAVWGAQDQYTFKNELPKSSIQVVQDTLETTHGVKATGFRVRVVSQGGASFQTYRGLHACATDRTSHVIARTSPENVAVELPVIGLSQMMLKDERSKRICSPTSTTAVIRFLSSSKLPNPLVFADAVRDSRFDIYGNWIFNTAESSNILGGSWQCYPARLSSFAQILEILQKGIPVVVSIKGPIIGGASPYESGHLLVVKGFDFRTKEVLCMDPAFPTDDTTSVRYALDNFLDAWSRRQGLAYIFQRIV